MMNELLCCDCVLITKLSFLVQVREQKVGISEVILHPYYMGKAYHDVAVIKLKPTECELLFLTKSFFDNAQFRKQSGATL